MHITVCPGPTSPCVKNGWVGCLRAVPANYVSPSPGLFIVHAQIEYALILWYNIPMQARNRLHIP